MLQRWGVDVSDPHALFDIVTGFRFFIGHISVACWTYSCCIIFSEFGVRDIQFSYVIWQRIKKCLMGHSGVLWTPGMSTCALENSIVFQITFFYYSRRPSKDGCFSSIFIDPTAPPSRPKFFLYNFLIISGVKKSQMEMCLYFLTESKYCYTVIIFVILDV